MKNVIKNLFLTLGLVCVVGNVDAMHLGLSKNRLLLKLCSHPSIPQGERLKKGVRGEPVEPYERIQKRSNVGGKKKTDAPTQFYAPKITQAPAKKQKRRVRIDDGKLPAIPTAQVTAEQLKQDKELRDAQEKQSNFIELCKSDDEKAVEKAQTFFNEHRWTCLGVLSLQAAFRNPHVKNPTMLLMLLKALVSEVRVLNEMSQGNRWINQCLADQPRDIGELLQEKFKQAVRADNIDLVYFLLLELKLKTDEKQPGSLIYPKTINDSGISEWVFEPFNRVTKQERIKLDAIQKHVESFMPANNAQEQEILDQDEEALTQALEKLVLFARGDA